MINLQCVRLMTNDLKVTILTLLLRLLAGALENTNAK